MDAPGTDGALEFGALLRQHRLAAGLTQEALADRAGLSTRAVQTLERGEHHPYRDTVERLARVLDLRGDDLRRLQLAARPRPRQVPLQPVLTPPLTSSPSPSQPPSQPAHNLPVALTGFVGRLREVEEASLLLDRTHLLTLTGTGGCGKTRLALEVARSILDSYPDGVWLVELAPLADPELVLTDRRPGPRRHASRPAADPRQRSSSTCGHKHLLLVLDNCEHLLDACASLAESLLTACPSLRVLATCRQALGIPGETTYRVPSLSLPDVARSCLPSRPR